MKAETVFNVATHLSDYELKRLHNLVADKLNLKPKNSKKKPLLTDEGRELYFENSI